MKRKAIFLLTLSALLWTQGPMAAQTTEPDSLPEWAVTAKVGRRLEASRSLQVRYPGLGNDLYRHLKEAYPNLEREVLDACLATWQSRPGEMMEIAQETRSHFGIRIENSRSAVKARMERQYPEFRVRMERVLATHGPASRPTNFLGFLSHRRELRQALAQEFPGGADVLVEELEREDATLVPELSDFLFQRTASLRTDLKRSLEERLPGLQAAVRTFLSERYPDLRNQLREILNS